jgi:hypothetical protein
MAHFNENDELVLSREEQIALLELLGNGVDCASLDALRLSVLEEMLFHKLGYDDESNSFWETIGHKG